MAKMFQLGMYIPADPVVSHIILQAVQEQFPETKWNDGQKLVDWHPRDTGHADGFLLCLTENGKTWGWSSLAQDHLQIYGLPTYLRYSMQRNVWVEEPTDGLIPVVNEEVEGF